MPKVQFVHSAAHLALRRSVSWILADIRLMNDEEGTQELCMQAARKLFGSPRRPQPRREQAALQEDGALSEDRFQVRCFCADSCSVSA